MSERDCGKWYCQKAAGFARFRWDEDVKIFPGTWAKDDDKRDLIRETSEVVSWMLKEREAGFAGWLAGPGHQNGSAHFYWVWEPDSRDKYMEMFWFNPGDVPRDFGEMHRGLGWQFPLLAVFTNEPTTADIFELREMKVPFVVYEPPVVEEPEPIEVEEEGVPDDELQEAIDVITGGDDDYDDDPLMPELPFWNRLRRADRIVTDIWEDYPVQPMRSQIRAARRQLKKALQEL